MVDVARRAGVSLKTVSRVVNNEPNVQQQLVDRVRAAVEELGFRRNQPGAGLDADTVLLDNRGGARAGMRSLKRKGHKRIGILLDSLDVFTMRERLEGARTDGAIVRDGVHDPVTAARAVSDMLDSADPPTAFFGLNNRMTVGIVQELWRRGSDAAVVGFDDFELSHLMPRR